MTRHYRWPLLRYEGVWLWRKPWYFTETVSTRLKVDMVDYMANVEASRDQMHSFLKTLGHPAIYNWTSND